MSVALLSCAAGALFAEPSAPQSKTNSVAVHDQADGYRWVGLTGTVQIIEDPGTAQRDIAEMARRYHADDPDEAEGLVRNFATQQRITFRVRIDAVHDHLD